MPSAPSYLVTSRFGHYYFRFPIPKHLHPERKQSSIRVSLDTRCPREALQLSRALSYAGIQLLQKPEIFGMDYLAIREMLFDHFKALRERMKERIHTHGRLTVQDKAALTNGNTLAQEALLRGDYSLVGTDAEIGRVIDDYALPIIYYDEMRALMPAPKVALIHDNLDMEWFHSYCADTQRFKFLQFFLKKSASELLARGLYGGRCIIRLPIIIFSSKAEEEAFIKYAKSQIITILSEDEFKARDQRISDVDRKIIAYSRAVIRLFEKWKNA